MNLYKRKTYSFKLHLRIILFTLLFSIFFIQSNNALSFSNKELRNAKLIESYYRSYQSRNLRKALRIQKKISGRTFLYKDLKPLLKLGKKTAYQILSHKDCTIPPKKSYQGLKKDFLNVISKACNRHMRKIISRRRRTFLNAAEKEFLKRDSSFFSSRSLATRFKKRFKRLNKKNKVIVSEKIKSDIYRSIQLPHKSAMTMIIPDEKITHFIQRNSLYGLKDEKYYQNTFNTLLTKLKNSFIEGEQEKLEFAYQSLERFYKSNEKRINDQHVWKKVLKSGKKLVNNQNYGHAINFLKSTDQYISQKDLSESYFQVIFTKYLNGDIYEAKEYIRNKKLITNFSKLDSRLMYWTAYISDLGKDLMLAKKLYKETIKNHPLSFYSILSLKRLQAFSPVDYNETLINKNHNIVSKRYLSSRILFLEKTLSLFKKSDCHIMTSLVATEMRKVDSKSFFKKSFTQKHLSQLKANYLISLFSKKYLFLDSFKTAYKGVDKGTLKISHRIIKSLFPKNFSKHVKSTKLNMDYRIVLSLIRQESGFNKKARSPAGARGLMQIMPRTGKYMKKNLVTKDLYNPKTNILLGSKYLRYLLKKYKGNLMFTLAAYNAGEGNVSKWKKRIPFSGNVISDIELIPFKETKKYVKLIYRNLFFYRLGDKDYNILKESPEETFNIAYFSKR